MEDSGMRHPNVELPVGDAAAGATSENDGVGSAVSAEADPVQMNSPAAPASSLSPLEIEGLVENEVTLGDIGMTDMAMFESLPYGMDLMTDDEVDNGKGKNKQQWDAKGRKRLSLYQVYALEKKFKVDSKLEMKRKYQIAKELGLDPRQVTVWFQNRRRRNKGKEIEIDYDKIIGQYNLIRAEYEKVVDENMKLKAQMEKMRGEMNTMKESLLNYGKLMKSGIMFVNPPPQQMMQTNQPNLFMQTNHQLHQDMHAQPQGQVMINSAQYQPQPQVMINGAQFQPQLQVMNVPFLSSQPQLMQQQITQPALLPTYNNNSNLVGFGNMYNGGVIAPQVQVMQPMVVNSSSPASVGSGFGSNSSQTSMAHVNQLLAAPVGGISDPVVVPAGNTNFIQADQPAENSSVNKELPNNNPIASLFDFDDQNCFYDFRVDSDQPSTSTGNFGINPMDDEAFWQFEL